MTIGEKGSGKMRDDTTLILTMDSIVRNSSG